MPRKRAPDPEPPELIHPEGSEAALAALDTLPEMTPEVFERVYNAYFLPHLPSLLAAELTMAQSAGKEGSFVRGRVFDRMGGTAMQRKDKKVRHDISLVIEKYSKDEASQQTVVIEHQPQVEIEDYASLAPPPDFDIEDIHLERSADRPNL